MKQFKLLIILTFLLSTALFPSDVAAQNDCGDVYVVRPGDTLIGIAERCDVTLQALLTANPEIQDPNLIFVGQLLSIDRTEPAREPDVSIAPVIGPPGTQVHLLASRFPADTRVAIRMGPWEGDSQLIGYTQTGSNGAINTSLVIPDYADPRDLWVFDVVVDDEDADIQATSNAFNVIQAHYQVQAGDTLSSIAARFNTTVDDLLDANPDIESPSRIFVGQQIEIPGRIPTQAASVLIPMTGAEPSGEMVVGLRGFPEKTPIELGLGESEDQYQVIHTAETNESGRFRTRLTVPENVDPSSDVIIARTLDGEQMIVTRTLRPVTSEPYRVKTGDILSALAVRFGTTVDEIRSFNPQLQDTRHLQTGMALLMPEKGMGEENQVAVIYPVAGAPGTEITLTATGFPSETWVNVVIHPLNRHGVIMAHELTDINGRLRMQLPVPQRANVGETWEVTVTTSDEARISASSNDFQVGEPAQLRTEWDRVTLHLVSIGDGQLGCNDRLQPVSVRIGPTRAPTMTALRQLLAIDQGRVDRMGLYNALGQSDLEIEQADIRDGRLTLNLSGEMTLGGVCDNPRFAEQIRQTATQYRNVDEVDVFINGEPLDEVLSER